MIDTFLDIVIGGWLFWIGILVCGLWDLIAHLMRGGKLKDWH